MDSVKHLRFDVAVVGAGPAGIAAALAAADSGRTVGLIDDNPAAGGQIWRAGYNSARPSASSSWFNRLTKSAVQIVRGARVFHAAKGELVAESDDSAIQIGYGKLILATGARELFLPFPGWTLPNVMGAGGLQAFAKSGLDISGKRILIAGTGPLLLAVAAYARRCGAKVIGICEQTTRPRMARFALKMMLVPGKAAEAARLAYELHGIPHWIDCWPVAAFGNRRVETVRISRRGQTSEIECDYLACGFHLIPNSELPRMCGCRLRQNFVQVDGLSANLSPRNILCGRTHRNWRPGAGARRRRNRRLRRYKLGRSRQASFRQARPLPKSCSHTARSIPITSRAKKSRAPRHADLPLRRRVARTLVRPRFLARRQIARPLRHGPLPRACLRARC